MFANQTTRRRTLHLLAATLLTAVAAACGGSDSTGPTPEPGPGGTPTVGTLTLVNNAQTGSALFFRRRACGTTTWSGDMLGSSILWGGEQQSWDLEPGCYDFRVTPSEVGLDYLYFNAVQLDAGESETLAIAAFPLEP
ncbi:MAG: hypothetical protein ACREL3_00350 [Gemmatimonadales bacterium]